MRNLVLSCVLSLFASGCLFAGSSEPRDEPDSGASDVSTSDTSNNNSTTDAASNLRPNSEPNAIPGPCGNGVLDDGETCDDSSDRPCIVACPPRPEGCAALQQRGAPETCNLRCEGPPLACGGPPDDCCPSDCNDGQDPDCPVENQCGNGVVDTGETCDKALVGSCPESCPDGDACTQVQLINPGTCRAECAVSVAPNCTPCNLGVANLCNCASDQLCSPEGRCVAGADGNRCDEACIGGDYCEVLDPDRPVCRPSGRCAECGIDADCAGQLICFGPTSECRPVGCAGGTTLCPVIPNGSVTCVGPPGASYCSGLECVQGADCHGFETCVTMFVSAFCVPADDCAIAPDGDLWCQVMQRGTRCNQATATCTN